MGILKKRLLIISALIILVIMIFLSNVSRISVKAINERQNPVKAAVLLYRFDDVYTSLVRQGFEEIQKNNPGKIEFTFYDGKNDQGIYAINLYIRTKIIVEYKFMSVIYE